MTAIAEALLEQHYDVHHRGRETPTPTGNSSSPNRWRRRDTTRAYLAEAEPIKELTDTAYLTTSMVSRMRRKTTKSMRRISPLCWVTRAKTQRADDALAEALQLDAVAMVAWQRFRQGQGQEQRQGKGQRQRQWQEQRKQSVFRGAQETSCRAEEPYQLSSVRCAWTLGRRRHLSQECQEREYIAITCTRISDYRRRDIRFRPRLDR